MRRAKQRRDGLRFEDARKARAILGAAGITLLLALISPSPARAQTPPGRMTFVTYGAERGCGAWNIEALAQDTNGFLWIGTSDGVHRYDGHRCRPIETPSGVGLKGGMLAAGRDGDMWVVTVKGAVRWHAGQWIALDAEQSLGSPLRAIATDASGRAWATAAGGLFREDDEGHFALVPGWPGGEADTIRIAASGEVYIGMEGAVRCWSPDGRWHTWGEEIGLGHGHLSVIAVEAHGRAWIYGDRRLWVLSTDSGKLEERTDLAGQRWLHDGIVDRRGTLWFPSSRGISRVDGGIARDVPELPVPRAAVVFEDREGSLWVAGTGLHRVAGEGLWRAHTSADGLQHNRIWAVRRDPAGQLWAGTQLGLARATPTGWAAVPAVPAITLPAILAAPDGTLWLGGWASEIYHYDPRLGALERFALPTEIANWLVFALRFDRSGVLWAATGAGVWKGEARAGSLQLEHVPLPSGSEQELIQDLLVDTRGRLWFASRQGLAVLEDGEVRRFGAQDGLHHAAVTSLLERRNGEICTSYAEPLGLSCFRYDDHILQSFTHLDTSRGLASNIIFSLGEDRADRLWVGSASGVDMIDGDRLQHFGTADGMPSDDCNAWAFFADPDGDVWVGTGGGIAQFLTSRYEGPPAPPRARLTSIRAGGRELAGSSGEAAIAYRQNTLEYELAVPSFLDEAAIEREVRLLGVESEWRPDTEQGGRYAALPPGRYELQARARRTRGEWGPIAGFALRIAPPWWQTWTFRAASALALLGLVALAFRWRERALRRRNAELANLVALRTRELEQAQERVVKLERDATEQQMAGGFAHEMRNVLTGAKVLLASVHSGSEESLCVENSSKLKDLFVLVKPHVPPDERPALIAAVRGIHANEKQLDTVLDDVDKALARGLATTRVLLDYARLGHERAGNEPVLLLPLVEAVIGESREDFSAHGIVVEIAIAPATTLPADEAHLYSILKNLVLNARDALVDNDGPRVLRIAFIEEAERRILRIEDTGVGIEPAHRARLFEPFFSTKARGGTGLGLGIVRKLVGLYGGTIAIESTVGDGTHLQITLPREGSGVRG